MIYDNLAQYYDQFLDSKLYKTYFKLIRKYVKKGNVIDLGTGTGVLSIELAKKDYFVTATDISERMLETAYNNAVVENVEIKFFIHDILEKLNQTYDVIIMSSDVINYLDNTSDIDKTFNNISEGMNLKSIFIFDFLKISYLNSLDNYVEEIDLGEEVINWKVKKTSVLNQVEHTLSLNNEIETHIQTTFPLKTYKELLKKQNLKVVKTKSIDERIILVCKRKSN